MDLLIDIYNLSSVTFVLSIFYKESQVCIIYDCREFINKTIYLSIFSVAVTRFLSFQQNR